MWNALHRRQRWSCKHLRSRFHPRLDVLEDRLTPSLFTVNTTADTDDGVADGANTTLREAINAANANPGDDSISFKIPGGGVQTIDVGSTGLGDLPAIMDRVQIDGYSQPGSKHNDAKTGFNGTLLIELNGEAVVNSNGGLQVLAAGVTVSGLIVNRFSGPGILVLNGDSQITGNFIGTNAAGTAASPNGIGIQMVLPVGAGPNSIGTASPYGRNVISGNQVEGIDVVNKTYINDNLIGTNAAGTAALPNGGTGVFVSGSLNTIRSNVICANGASNDPQISYHHGIVLTQPNGYDPSEPYDSDVGQNQVNQNLIGVSGDGTSPLGNAADGVYVELSKHNSITDNTIAHNGRNGVTVAGDDRTLGNWITRNRISQNGNLGIDLGADGPTLNDASDADTGANDLQNYPAIDKVVLVHGTLTVSYYAPSGARGTVEFFRADAQGQGELFLAYDDYSNATAGQLRSFSVKLSQGILNVGDFITATAIDNALVRGFNTSEFAPAVQAVAADIVVTPTGGFVTSSLLMTNELGAKATFTVVLLGKPTANVTLTLRSSNETEGTLSASQLVFTPNNFDRPQTVTITGVDDVAADGDMDYLIQFDPAVSADLNYNGLDPADIMVRNLDDESGDSRVFINPPASVVPGERFTYEVIVVNLGAPRQFTVSFDLQTTPPNLAEIEQIVMPRRARSRSRHNRAAPAQFNLDQGESKTVTIRARALEGSGGAALHAEATAQPVGGTPVSATADSTVSVEPLILTFTAPSKVKTFPIGPGVVRFGYDITVSNPNAVPATAVTLTLAFGTDQPTITAGTIFSNGNFNPIAGGTGPFSLGDVAPGEQASISLTALGKEDNTYDVTATLAGSLAGKALTTSPSSAKRSTEVTQGAVEWLFLAGLAALAGQEWLDQRRRRRKKANAETDDQDATDDVFEEMATAR